MNSLFLAIALQAAPTSTERLRGFVEALRAADAALVAGNGGLARGQFERALQLSDPNPTVAYGLACAAAREGQEERALDWLDRALEWGWVDQAVARWDPDLDSVRSASRFEALLERMKPIDHERRSRLELDSIWRMIQQEDPRARPSAVTITPMASTSWRGTTTGRVLVLDAETGLLVRELPRHFSAIWKLRRLARLAAVGSDLQERSPLPVVDRRRANPIVGHRIGTQQGSVPVRRHALLEPAGRARAAGRRARRREPLVEGRRPRGTLVHSAAELGRARRVDARRRARPDRGGQPRARTRWPNGGAPVDADRSRLADLDLAISPDGAWVVTGHAGGWGVLWDLARGKEFRRRQFVDPFAPEPEDEIASIAFSPDGLRLAWTTRQGSHAELTDLATFRLLWQSEYYGAHFGEPMPMAWSPDGTRIWYAFVCGMGELVTPRAPTECRAVLWIGRSAGLRLRSWRIRLRRRGGGARRAHGATALAAHRDPGGYLIQAPSRHFTGQFEELPELTLGQSYVREQRSLEARHVEQLFDPKRVRAAQAGIRSSRRSSSRTDSARDVELERREQGGIQRLVRQRLEEGLEVGLLLRRELERLEDRFLVVAGRHLALERRVEVQHVVQRRELPLVHVGRGAATLRRLGVRSCA
jgi:hypothetical protein